MHRTDGLHDLPRPRRVGVKRGILPILAAWALALSVNVGVSAVPATVSAACVYTWTGLMTDSGSGTNGSYSYSSTVNYKLEFNTCNLGVYTRIYVDKYVDKFTITGDTFGFTYSTDNSAVLKNCNNFGAECLIYPGTAVYVDNRVFSRTGNGTITRTTYPRVTYAYNKYSAIGDRLRYIDGGVIFHFVYQFIRDVAYDG